MGKFGALGVGVAVLAAVSVHGAYDVNDYIASRVEEMFRNPAHVDPLASEATHASRVRSKRASPKLCIPHPSASPALTTPTPAITAALSTIAKLCQNSTATGAPSGCYVSVQYVGSQWLDHGYGTADGGLNGGVPVDADTVFNIASVSKVFTSLVAARAIESGSVPSWDTSLAELDPRFSIHPPGGVFAVDEPGKITLSQLLSHQAGLPRESPCGPVSAANGAISTCNSTVEQVLENLAGMSMIGPTWHQPSYSNLGFSLMGRLVAEAASRSPGAGQQTYEALVSSLCESMGLSDTSFYPSATKGTKATGFKTPGQPFPEFDLGFDNPAGGVRSTGRDLSRLVTRLIGAWWGQGGGGGSNSSDHRDGVSDTSAAAAGVSSESLRSLLQPGRWVNPDMLGGFATPWEVDYIGGYAARTKAGNLDSWASSISLVPELGIGVVALWNGPQNSYAFGQQAMSLLIPPLVSALEPLVPQPIPSQRGASAYKGAYQLPAGGLVLKAGPLPDGRLVIQYMGFNLLLSYLNTRGQSDYFNILLYGDTVPCTTNEFQALNGETIVFQMGDDGSASSIAVPGLVHGVVFPRIA